MKILISEDDNSSLLYLSTVLRKNGYDVIETQNGKEALTILKRDHTIKLAIIDWMMPEMDGLELCKEVRKLEYNVPPYLIMLTSKNEKKDVITVLENGANDYITKPFDIHELKARISVGKRMIRLQIQLYSKIKELENQVKLMK